MAGPGPTSQTGRDHGLTQAGRADERKSLIGALNCREAGGWSGTGILCCVGSSGKGGRTAEEVVAELWEDQGFRERFERAEADRARHVHEMRVAAAPLLDELAEAGHPVPDVWLLKAPYPDAVPVLLRHLGRAYPEVVRAGIAHRLAVPEARLGAHVRAD
jgi:hypothetical protein